MTSLNALQSHQEKIEVPSGSHLNVNLQPICKLNSVMMEIVGNEIIISGPEINVKRAKLQLLHSM